MFKRIGILLTLMLLALSATALARVAPEPTADGLTLSANCNVGGGIVLAQGLRHVPAGEAILTNNENITEILGIGSSGQDGVCYELTQAKATRRDLAPINMLQAGRLVRQTANGIVGDGARQRLADLIIDNDGNSVDVAFNENLNVSLASLIILNDDQPQVTVPPTTLNGDIAQIENNGAGITLDSTSTGWTGCLTCTVPFAGAAMPTTLDFSLGFADDVKFLLPGGGSFVGDTIVVSLTSPDTIRFNDGSLEFANTGNVTLLGTAHAVAEQSHTIADARVFVSDAAGPVTVERAVGSPVAVNSVKPIDKSTPLLSVAGGTFVGAPYGFPTANDSLSLIANLSLGLEDSGLAESRVTFFGRANGGTRICPSFDSWSAATANRITVTRNGQTIVDTTVPAGNCVVTNQALRIENFRWYDETTQEPCVFTAGFSVPGQTADFEIQITPDAPEVPSLDYLVITMENTIDYTIVYDVWQPATFAR